MSLLERYLASDTHNWSSWRELYRKENPTGKGIFIPSESDIPNIEFEEDDELEPTKITYCKRGHPWEGDNIHITSTFNKMCRACRNERQRKYYHRQNDLLTSSKT